MLQMWKTDFFQKSWKKIYLPLLQQQDFLQTEKNGYKNKGVIIIKMKQETQEKIQELQMSEQAMQNILLQRQAFQIELNETESALAEVGKAKDDVYKIVGQIMLKSEKADLKKELDDRKKILELRLKTIEKQEEVLRTKLENLKKAIEEELKSK